jgi:hypothetical protein
MRSASNKACGDVALRRQRQLSERMLTDVNLTHPDELNSGYPACMAACECPTDSDRGPQERRSFIDPEV